MKLPAQMKTRIDGLVRSNIALAALCVISLGILTAAVHRSSADNGQATTSTGMAIQTGQVRTRAISSMPSNGVDLKDMPPPSSFQSFIYQPGADLPIDGRCADTYQVVMIFPELSDYRSDPLSAKYNTAEPCVQGQPYSETIDLDALKLEVGNSYYVVKADEGTTGPWTNPH